MSFIYTDKLDHFFYLVLIGFMLLFQSCQPDSKNADSNDENLNASLESSSNQMVRSGQSLRPVSVGYPTRTNGSISKKVIKGNTFFYSAQNDQSRYIDFEFNVIGEGFYDLSAVVHAPTGGSNSFFTQINKDNRKTWHIPSSQIPERRIFNESYYLKSGKNLARFYVRESNTKIADLVVRPAKSVPSNTGENSRELEASDISTDGSFELIENKVDSKGCFVKAENCSRMRLKDHQFKLDARARYETPGRCTGTLLRNYYASCARNTPTSPRYVLTRYTDNKKDITKLTGHGCIVHANRCSRMGILPNGYRVDMKSYAHSSPSACFRRATAWLNSCARGEDSRTRVNVSVIYFDKGKYKGRRNVSRLGLKK